MGGNSVRISINGRRSEGERDVAVVMAVDSQPWHLCDTMCCHESGLELPAGQPVTWADAVGAHCRGMFIGISQPEEWA